MIKQWRRHNEYVPYLLDALALRYSIDPEGVERHEPAILKALILDLDSAMEEIASLYPPIGRPAQNQPELLRSLIIMSEYHVESPAIWRGMLENEPVLRIIVGLPKEELHGVGSYYDLIDRLWRSSRDKQREARKKARAKPKKPKKRPKGGEKLPPRHPGIIAKLARKALEGRSLTLRPELFMQRVFAKAAVEPAAAEGLYGDVHDIPLSGDGTCLGTGGASRGIAACQCRHNGAHKCDCPRRYSDTDARWGFNSYTDKFFFGHTLYALAHHNADLKADIPIYVRIVEAPRFDGVTAIVAFSEFYELYPDFEMGVFIGDSAHDNIATYNMLRQLNVDAVIALNGRNAPSTLPFTIDGEGVPLCAAGRRMVYWGYCRDRDRFKYRCPFACGKVASCGMKGLCSPSDYGRTVYTSPGADARMFTAIPRHSDLWKKLMRSRTASERFNKRSSLDYPLANTRLRGKKRIFMRAVANAINIVLDARLKNSAPDLWSLLWEPSAA